MKKHCDARTAISVRAFIAPCLGSLCCVTNHPKVQGIKRKFVSHTIQCVDERQLETSSLGSFRQRQSDGSWAWFNELLTDLDTQGVLTFTSLAFQLRWLQQLWMGQIKSISLSFLPPCPSTSLLSFSHPLSLFPLLSPHYPFKCLSWTSLQYGSLRLVEHFTWQLASPRASITRNRGGSCRASHYLVLKSVHPQSGYKEPAQIQCVKDKSMNTREGSVFGN